MMKVNTLRLGQISVRQLLGYLMMLSVLFVGLLATSAAWAITVNVVDNADPPQPVNGFRWLLQEDTTFPVDPDFPATNPDDLLSLGFHASYHPPAQDALGQGLSGNSGDNESSVTIDAPLGQRYYVSVLPYAGYSISGQPVEVVDGDETVTVTVQDHPIPTSQISVFLFHDNRPINGAPDLPEESSPSFLPNGDPIDWTQFNIIVEEPGGKYGIAGGQVIQDAFGNPLGTTYDGAGNVLDEGDGTVHPDANGFLTIKNLPPGKFGIIAIPPTPGAGEQIGWQQTSTIEGSKVIDAWVKANEPPFFVEFGPPGPHVFIGFIKSTVDGGFPPLAGTTEISGNITDMHLSRPPSTQFFSGRPFPGCWVGLNDLTVGVGEGIFAAPCDGDSYFAIPNVPPGNYQLKVFDANLDVLIATLPVTVDPAGSCNGGSCAFGEVAVFNWFARLDTLIFNDVDQDGFQDDPITEPGIGPESQDVSIRWRDGTIYQNFPTDGEGFAPFDEVFPFFHWLVAEVSFANKKATGATFVVDAGGEVRVDGGWADPTFDALNPQPQADINPNTGNNLSRTETGQVLTAGFQGFLGQTSVMQFGKTDYLGFDFSNGFPPTFVGENGGISGIVFNTVTRAEDEPQFAAAEEWEPGVPRVQLALYADGDIDSFPPGTALDPWPNSVGDVDWNADGVLDGDDDEIDDINGVPGVQLADVDNHPLGWADGTGTRGAEDVDHDDPDHTLVSDAAAVFDLGDAVQVTWTDSWDDSLPTGCQGVNDLASLGVSDDRCFDGLRNFNQIRPAVFDGGYAFADYDLEHLGLGAGGPGDAIQAYYDAVNTAVSPEVAATLQLGLVPGDYIVEAAAPPGFEHIKEEDRNVDFGDEYDPTTEALPVACVGDLREVPPLFSMSTKDGSGDLAQLIGGLIASDVAAPFAGDVRPLCHRKKVPLSSAQNAAAEFFLMTDVPVAANVSGVILNDLANEFDPNNPNFSEKFAPPLLPVAFYDFNGSLVNRVHADQFGRYNLLVPSTWTANIGIPSGMSPNMLISCMNDAGPIPNPDYDPTLDADGNGIDDNGEPANIVDPFHDAQYSQFCYTFQYMPGSTTYLDTPVVPIAAFTTPGSFPVDCERPTSTPMIASVTRSTNDGPYVLPGEQIIIASMGMTDVPNPEWDGVDLSLKNVTRDYSFSGAGCSAWLEDADGIPAPGLTGVSCAAAQITATVPATIDADGLIPYPAGEYQVVVANSDGAESPIGVTLTVGPFDGTVHSVSAGDSIQAAIDVAGNGDLILVGPGVYNELVIMYKPVKLQGWGADVVTINARQAPTETIAAWRDKVAALVASGDIEPLPGQENNPFGFPALAEALFPTEEGAGIFVAGGLNGNVGLVLAGNGKIKLAAAEPQGVFGDNSGARIDGLTIVGASTGGGIVVNGYAEDLSIGNSRITGNAGFFGGGIRVGHAQISHEIIDEQDPSHTGEPNGEVGDLVYDDARNDNIRIHHNHVAQNGGFGGVGGGISLYTGADNYQVKNNWICGNFGQGDGAGIGHLGLSDQGLIEDNFVIFNESFRQTPGSTPSGAGIAIAGQVPLDLEAETELLLSPGSGDVTVDSNLIRGNLAGAGDGGGIHIARVNGHDVAATLGVNSGHGQWYKIELFNNMVDNNVAALAGGGIAIQDALKVDIRNNTVANNDSTATAGVAFEPGITNQTTPQPAGIVSRVHSPEMVMLMSDVDDAFPGPNFPFGTWLRFSDPTLEDTIVLHNRSFYWVNFDDPGTPEIETGLFPASCADPVGNPADPECDVATATLNAFTDDLAVMDGLVESVADLLDPQDSMLTDTTGYDASNVAGLADNLDFVNGYFNVGRDSTLIIEEPTVLQTAGAFDEGGNFIQVKYGPLSLVEPDAVVGNAEGPLFDYHLAAGSAAIGAGANALPVDIDNDLRPQGLAPDIGADEVEVQVVVAPVLVEATPAKGKKVK